MTIRSTESENRLMLRVNEAAEVLGIGRTTVYELVAKGELPTVRIGRSVRIPISAIEAWVEANTEGVSSGDSDLQGF